MKISQYTFLFEIDNEFYLYNTLSNALLETDKIYFDKLHQFQVEKIDFSEKEFDNEFYQVLVEKRFITENQTDELLFYKGWISQIRNTQNMFNLTISPTMDCNFNCHYCFEQHEKSYISEQIIDNLVSFINSHKNIDSFHLTWFGGEPLMAIDKIKLFYDKFRPTWQNKFSSNIITTGYLLTPENIDILKQVEINSVQITLDGTKEFHNQIKKDKNCIDVFSKTIEKIDMLTELAPDIQINIRVNLTKQNAEDFVTLYNFIINRYKNKNVGISHAFVMNRNKSKNSDIFFNRQEQVDYVLNLTYKHKIASNWIQYPSTFMYECAVRNVNCYGIDPDGYVYKCWENIGKKKYAFAKLTDEGYMHSNQTQLYRILYGADPLDDAECKKCSYLPLCNGGCPFHRIENEFENGNSECCTSYKNRLEDFFKIYIKLKKSGYYNQFKKED